MKRHHLTLLKEKNVVLNGCFFCVEEHFKNKCKTEIKIRKTLSLIALVRSEKHNILVTNLVRSTALN